MTISRRTIVLMLVLLVLVFGYVSRPYGDTTNGGPSATQEPPLPGKNLVSSLAVSQDSNGRWFASFDYFYVGAPQGVLLHVRVRKAAGVAEPEMKTQRVAWARAERGQHHLKLEVMRPYMADDGFTTERVEVEMADPTTTVASAVAAQRIEWPDYQTWTADRDLVGKTPAQVFGLAVSMIDNGNLARARQLLERLIGQDPQLDAGYVELARIAMKSNWGPEGLHQAEGFLSSALGIRPTSIDAKVLLGYVYAHQSRYKQAESLFAESAAAGTKNLWLWANWGEVLAMQGKTEPAIEKYRQALAVPPTHDTNDRARVDAYTKLLSLLEGKNDVAAIEALYKQRIEDYGQADCVGADYAMFTLRRRGDTARAIELARQVPSGQCGRRATLALGMAQYVAWANAPESERTRLLNLARVSLPLTAGLLYELAVDEHTAEAVKTLAASGEPIDQRDNGKFNALSYALQKRDHTTARRLLAMGAKPATLVGPVDMPVALLPLVSGDAEGVRLMRRYGVDYSKLVYQGHSALDIARQLGDRRVLDALGSAEQKNRL